ncbi:hypothetical protein MMC25_005367 [Agyrium rufum]|nr:hypothetical protein [Agyrium rufum]
MFGPFKPTSSLSGGLLWKIPWRLSQPRKARQRKRLRLVDNVVDVLDNALAKKGLTTKSLERWKAEMPREEEMRPKDKYTIYDRKEKSYRKGIHMDKSITTNQPARLLIAVSVQSTTASRALHPDAVRTVQYYDWQIKTSIYR